MADVAKQLDLGVILVVAMRLGCLNHAMLSAEAIRRDGLKIVGWIANSLTPEPMAYEAENLATLHSALGAPLIAQIPYCATKNPEDVCNSVNLECLDL